MLFPLLYIPFHIYMQTLTFTQKLLRQRSFFNFLIPLFAVFVGLGASQRALAQASTVTLRTVDVTNGNGTGGVPLGRTTYDASTTSPGITNGRPNFEGTNFGLFDTNTGDLFFNGGIVEVQVAPGETVNEAFIDYRVFQGNLASSDNPPFETFQLDTVGLGPDATGKRRFRLNTASINIIQLTFGPNPAGLTFRFDVVPRAIARTARNTFILGGTAVFSTFMVTGPVAPVPGSTSWRGNGTDDWFTPTNWTNGVPNSSTNAFIPDFGAEIRQVVYPNINAIGRDAECRDLTLGGSTQAQRSICRLISGRLKVFGNFNNRQSSFIQRDNVVPASILELAGGRLQRITSGDFTRVEVSGLGDKELINSVFISTFIRFMPGAMGNILTDISEPGRSFLELADRLPSNGGNGAQLTGETDDAHVIGFVKTTRGNVVTGEKRTYGNIGMELTFKGSNDPGNILVTRNTAESYAPVSNRFGIRRIFGVRPTDPNSQFGSVTADMRFYYLDAETRNLRTEPTTPSTQGGSGTLNEATLALYLSTNGGNSFIKLGRDSAVNTVRNYINKNDVTSFATFTLADEVIGLPLPVVLAAFDAKRTGADALLTWTTASEKNSKGFNVQVSTDGKSFRNLGFVASLNGNSSSSQNYRFVDAESNKSGLRYYRLNQVDVDGKNYTSSVRTVNFNGVQERITQESLAAYPNPFTSELSVTVAGSGSAVLRLTDLTGRTIRSQQVQLEGSANTLSLDGLAELKNGVYVVQLTLPSGESQNFRVQKQ